MKIGIDARTALLHKKGGFGVYTRNLINSMALLYPQYDFNLKYQKKIEHYFDNIKNINTKKLSFPINSLWTQLRLPIHFLNYKPDVFLFPCQTISRFSNSRKVVTIHDLRFKAIKRNSMSEFLRLDFQIKNCIKYSDQIICVSNKTKFDLLKYYSVDHNKIHVIHHGVDHIHEINKSTVLHKREDLFKKYKISKEFLLTVGYTHRHKNITSVIDCLNQLINEGNDLMLVIVGPNGNDEVNIQKKICALNLQNRVIRINFADSRYLGSLYYHSKLFIYPSLYEGFGFPVLEAMRCGGIVLGSKSGSIEEIGGNAMNYFDVNDPIDLFDKTKKIIHNEKKREGLQIKGYEHSKSFSWINTAKKTMKVLGL
tara:strand:+ start:2580 stop:3683 length:1104 start_codon:yes stop_codon:yes gene_type:complete